MIDADLLYQRIREQIKKIRTSEPDFRLSQAELGAILGLKRSSVANIEAGAQRASIHNIYEICDHFGLELSDLLPSIDSVRETPSAASSSDDEYDIDTGLYQIVQKLRDSTN